MPKIQHYTTNGFPESTQTILQWVKNLMTSLIVIGCMVMPAWSQNPVSSDQLDDNRSPIAVVQGFISKADGERCPMAPSCSAYASQVFKKHGLLIGWVLTCDRLLRCGRDETRLSPIIQTKSGPRVLDSVEANTFWWTKK